MCACLHAAATSSLASLPAPADACRPSSPARQPSSTSASARAAAVAISGRGGASELGGSVANGPRGGLIHLGATVRLPLLFSALGLGLMTLEQPAQDESPARGQDIGAQRLRGRAFALTLCALHGERGRVTPSRPHLATERAAFRRRAFDARVRRTATPSGLARVALHVRYVPAPGSFACEVERPSSQSRHASPLIMAFSSSMISSSVYWCSLLSRTLAQKLTHSV